MVEHIQGGHFKNVIQKRSFTLFRSDISNIFGGSATDSRCLVLVAIKPNVNQYKQWPATTKWQGPK